MRKPIHIKIADLRQKQLMELFRIAEQVFKEFGVDFYLLGAVARDAWFAKEEIRSRTTRDIDFALYVSGRKQYESLINKLIEYYGFSEIKEVPFRLQTPFGYTVDLIPFAEINTETGLSLNKDWDRLVLVEGFKEIYRFATVTTVTEENGLMLPLRTTCY